jgi:hypothetical protein
LASDVFDRIMDIFGNAVVVHDCGCRPGCDVLVAGAGRPRQYTVTLIGEIGSGFIGASLAPNGDVYANPESSYQLARVYTSNDTVVLLDRLKSG